MKVILLQDVKALGKKGRNRKCEMTVMHAMQFCRRNLE